MDTNLWTAASDGNLDRIRFLLESGAHRTNDADDSGYAHQDVLEYLLSRPDVDVNVKDLDGDTPLHVCEEVNTAKVLLRAGAHLNALNTHGFTPAALAREEGHMQLAAFLDGEETGEKREPDAKRRRDKSECGEARYLHCGIACVRTSGGSLAREDERVISLKQQNVGRQAIGFCEKTSAELFPLFNTLYEGLA